MRLPRLFRTTPFRLTLLFLALFAGSASGFLAYIYTATVGEVTHRAQARVGREMASLQKIYARSGPVALNEAVIERASSEGDFLYLLTDQAGRPMSGTIGRSPTGIADPGAWVSFYLTEADHNGGPVTHPAGGVEEHLADGQRLFVGADLGESESYVLSILRALWGAGALMIVLGLAGGIAVSRNVGRNIMGLTQVIGAVRAGNLEARAKVRGAGDEYDELALGLNEMLDRLERSIGGLRHAGDAIAHDLRSPLTRLRARLEAAMIDVEAGRSDPMAALRRALEDAESLLRTFTAVLAIGRLEAVGEAPSQERFDLGEVAKSIAELYQPLCEDKHLDLQIEIDPNTTIRGNCEFIAQATANILDNAIKYTPPGGAVMLRVRTRGSGDGEISVTDTGPGVPEGDRHRVLQRFVRLDNSRHQPGAGLGLSLVAAVAAAHGGSLEMDDGPGVIAGFGPGLRVALVLPRLG